MNDTILRFISGAHVGIFRLSRGRIGARVGDGQTMLLTTIGRKSGRLRTKPVNYITDNGNYVVIASGAGQDDPPAWWLNLEDNPTVRVELRDERFMAKAHSVEGEERERLWQKTIAAQPSFADTQEKTERELPVVVITPRGDLQRSD